jgi:hypothetical protein
VGGHGDRTCTPIPSLVFFASNLPTLLPSLQDAFLLALKQYLQQHSYNNTHASDLWNAANATLPFDVPAAMVQWTYQAGYPLVSLTLDDRRRVWLHQAPFSLRGVSACDPSRAWWIPIRCNQAGRGGGWAAHASGAVQLGFVQCCCGCVRVKAGAWCSMPMAEAVKDAAPKNTN